MQKTSLHRFQAPFFLFVFPLYPVIFLIANNIGQIEWIDTIRPICFSLLFGFITFSIIRLISKELITSSVLTILILVMFFTYGHVFDFLYPFRIQGFKLARNSILISFYFLIFMVLLNLIIHNKHGLKKFISFLNLFSVILLIFPLVKITGYSLSRLTLNNPDQSDTNIQLRAPKKDESPDIYFIVLDGYNRQDVLFEDFSFDNSKFINGLKEMGFFVAECSRSNYDHTNVALASELNLNYMQNLIPPGTVGEYEARVVSLLNGSFVITELEKAGYGVYQFYNDTYPWLNWKDVNEIKLSEQTNIFNNPLTPFEQMFINTTALKILTLHFPEFFEMEKGIEISRFDAKKQQELFILKTLPALAQKTGPKFVNAHLLITHTPFIFSEDGTTIDSKFREYPLSDDLYREGYINQTIFLNNQLLPILKTLIEESKNPPIIILQSDHGNKNDVGDKVNRPNQILNAFYFPDNLANAYSRITPVNTFRIIFNAYFSTDFPLLEDISYKVTNLKDYTYEEVFETYEGCK